MAAQRTSAAAAKKRATKAAPARARATRPAAAPPPIGPTRLDDLWLPIGPTTVIGGQGAGIAHVSGRVRQVQVSPNGTRLYAATANGGVWYSRDQGSSWIVLGGWEVTPDATNLDFFANTLVCGSIVVDWDTAPNGENDTVYVGTGEIVPRVSGHPGGKLGGIGVLRAENPVAKIRAKQFDQIWSREATDLTGLGVFRLAFDPADHTRIAAATSGGLWLRSATSNTATWTKVTADPFDHQRAVTDALWLAAATVNGPTRLFVATKNTTLLLSVDGGANFAEINLDDRIDGRIGLAATDGSVIYALGDGPRLWRISGTTAKRVANVPARLFGRDENEPTSNQSSYDLAIAVHPNDANVVVLGGSAIETSNASLFKCTVTDPGGSPKLDYKPINDTPTATQPDGTPGQDPTFIGRGVHPDVHGITFAARGATIDLWVACDGGVFRSTRGGANHSWQSRNNGLAAIEPGYLACHPTHDSVVVVGTQDNGVLRRTGDTTWTWELGGDGGGVAFHPSKPDVYVAQSTKAGWRTNKRAITPVKRHTPLIKSEKDEDGAASFYSAPGVVTATNAEGARLAIGTKRVWVSENFGTTWYTVKTGSDPRDQTPGHSRDDTKQDVRYDDERDQVLVCKWLNENELYALCEHSVQRFTRNPGTSAWERAAVTDHHNKCFEYAESDIDGATMPYLPPLGEWSDIAFHVPGPNGSTTLYVACVGEHGAPKMDTLWWFDGVKTWWPTGLRTAAKSPALSVMMHPTDANIVFVGTTIGVWKGIFGRVSTGDPSWEWLPFSSGLPEAAVQDLAVFHDPAEPLTLLRAALQARGVWEVDLRGPCDEKTYVRVHAFDSRRRAQTTLVDPTAAAPAPDLNMFRSPDIVIRPDVPATAGEVPAFGGIIDASHKSTSHELWAFQSAFRAIDPTCRPTGLWSEAFQSQLVAYKTDPANNLGNAPAIDAATWTSVVTQARLWQPPWDGETPTEADFVDLPIDDNNSAVIVRFAERRLAVDVLVHHRGLEAITAGDVSVLLLIRHMTELRVDWASRPIDAAWKTQTVSALTGGAIPASGQWPGGGGWAIADTTPVRHPLGDLDAARPQAASFKVSFPSSINNERYMLLAVCSSRTATINAARLPGATLGELLVRSSHVAAHELQVRV